MSARLATPCVAEDDFDLLILLFSLRIAAMVHAHEFTPFWEWKVEICVC